MEQYSVTGMTCAACQARVEKVVSNVPGVTDVSVSLLTNSMESRRNGYFSRYCGSRRKSRLSCFCKRGADGE